MKKEPLAGPTIIINRIVLTISSWFVIITLAALEQLDNWRHFRAKNGAIV